jgi:hypothetical protein
MNCIKAVRSVFALIGFGISSYPLNSTIRRGQPRGKKNWKCTSLINDVLWNIRYTNDRKISISLGIIQGKTK